MTESAYTRAREMVEKQMDTDPLLSQLNEDERQTLLGKLEAAELEHVVNRDTHEKFIKAHFGVVEADLANPLTDRERQIHFAWEKMNAAMINFTVQGFMRVMFTDGEPDVLLNTLSSFGTTLQEIMFSDLPEDWEEQCNEMQKRADELFGGIEGVF